jgi:haloalkane dehalogenase
MPITAPGVYRAPEARFDALTNFPYAPHYRDWQGLRLAHYDEGPRDAPVALLVHGMPTWGYLYHTMIPPLLAAGYRIVAPDHPGFGRSDKPTDDNWYRTSRHVESLRQLIETLDLKRITLFVHDWGGPIGLRQVVEMPDRFARLAIMNTWLHHDGFTYNDGVRWWREAAADPAQYGGDMPTGQIVAAGLGREGHDKEAVAAAYDAPFEGVESKAGARRFPVCLPFGDPELGDAALQARDYEALPKLAMPKHVLFGDADLTFTTEWGRQWAEQLGATFDIIPGAGHFCQEDAGADVVEAFLARRGPGEQI